MDFRIYIVVSGLIFGIIACFHSLRIAQGWEIVLGPRTVPKWASWLGAILPALLCIWAFKLVAALG